MSTPRTRFHTGLSVLVGILLLPVAALSANDKHTQMRFPISLSVTNSCNGEIVDFTGELHVNSFVKNNKDGSTSYVANINYSNAHGIGQTTGDEYIFGSTSHSITTFPAGSTTSHTYTQRQTSKLVSAGSGPNQRFTFLLEYFYDGTNFHITLNDFEIRCTGN